MSFQRLRSHLKSIDVENDIIVGRRNNKENIKSKILVPILQTFGWKLLQDMDFDRQGLDIVLSKDDKPAIIVLVKSWHEIMAANIDQYLAYSLRLNCPWIFLSTGQHMALFCTLLDQENLSEAEPMIRVAFADLIGDHGNRLLGELDQKLGKNHFFRKDHLLYNQLAERLGGRSIEEAQIEFVKAASLYVRDDQSRQSTAEGFLSQLRHHSRQVSGALVYLHAKMVNTVHLNHHLHLRYGNKAVGLEYEAPGKPHGGTLNLFDIYPEGGRIAFGQDEWKTLNITAATFDEINNISRQAHSIKWAREVGGLLERAIREISLRR
jgi:hypothetical protein